MAKINGEDPDLSRAKARILGAAHVLLINIEKD